MGAGDDAALLSLVPLCGILGNVGSGAVVVIRQSVASLVVDRCTTAIAPDTRSTPSMSVRA